MQKRRLFPPPPPRLSSEVSSAGGRLVPPGEPSSVRFSRDTCARPHSLLRFRQLGLKISLARATAELPERPHARRARARGPWKRRGCRLRGAAPWGPAPTPAVRTPCRSRPRPCPAPPSGPTAAERHGGGVGAGGGRVSRSDPFDHAAPTAAHPAPHDHVRAPTGRDPRTTGSHGARAVSADAPGRWGAARCRLRGVAQGSRGPEQDAVGAVAEAPARAREPGSRRRPSENSIRSALCPRLSNQTTCRGSTVTWGPAPGATQPQARGGRPAPRQRRVMKFCVNGRISRKHGLVLREQLGTDVFLRSELAKSSARPRLWGQEVTAEASSPSLPSAP